MTLQPYYLLPIKTRSNPEGQGAPWAVPNPPLLLGKPLRSSLISKMQYQTKPSAERPAIEKQTIPSQKCWRRRQLVCPPWRAIQKYLSILQVLQTFASAVTSINATNAWIFTPSHSISGSLPKTHPKHGQHDIHTGYSTAALLSQHKTRNNQLSAWLNKFWQIHITHYKAAKRHDENTVPLLWYSFPKYTT